MLMMMMIRTKTIHFSIIIAINSIVKGNYPLPPEENTPLLHILGYSHCFDEKKANVRQSLWLSRFGGSEVFLNQRRIRMPEALCWVRSRVL